MQKPENIIQNIDLEEAREKQYKMVSGNRVILIKSCSHCQNTFYARRKNQKYCSTSCRVMACYERKDYKYQSGRYIKSNISMEKVNQDQKFNSSLGNPSVSPTNPAIVQAENAPTKFDWVRAGESALGAAAVEAVKYLAHDQKLMEKVCRIEAIIQGKANNFGGLKYLGVQNIGGIHCAIFEDKQKRLIANDENGKWYMRISKSPVKWQVIKPLL